MKKTVRKGRTPKVIQAMINDLRMYARCEQGSVDKLTGDLVEYSNKCEKHGIYINVDAITREMDGTAYGHVYIPSPFWGFTIKLNWNKSRLDSCRMISAAMYREKRWATYISSSLWHGIAAISQEVK